MHGTYLGRSGTFVLYIGYMVPIWVGAVRLSYIQDAWYLSGEERYACPIYRMHGTYLGRSGAFVLYIGYMVPIWVGGYVCPIYRMHGTYMGRSGTSVLYI